MAESKVREARLAGLTLPARPAPHAAPGRPAARVVGRHPGDAAAGACPDGAGFCGVAAAAALLGDAWTLLLIRDLAGGPQRFTKLQASTGISPRVLTDRLRALVDQGVMTRRMYPEIPPRVEYALTEKGRDVLPVIDALRAYGRKWLRQDSEDGRDARDGLDSQDGQNGQRA